MSVLYRGFALPVAWQILPANTHGAWMPHLLRPLHLLWRAVPPSMEVLVLADRGLWSPRLWKRIRTMRWHPVLRLQDSSSVRPLLSPEPWPEPPPNTVRHLSWGSRPTRGIEKRLDTNSNDDPPMETTAGCRRNRSKSRSTWSWVLCCTTAEVTVAQTTPESWYSRGPR